VHRVGARPRLSTLSGAPSARVLSVPTTQHTNETGLTDATYLPHLPYLPYLPPPALQ